MGEDTNINSISLFSFSSSKAYQFKMATPSAVWVLAHPSCVSLNDESMLAAAAAIPDYSLRSDRRVFHKTTWFLLVHY